MISKEKNNLLTHLYAKISCRYNVVCFSLSIPESIVDNWATVLFGARIARLSTRNLYVIYVYRNGS